MNPEGVRERVVDVEVAHNQRRVGDRWKSILGGDLAVRLPSAPDAIAVDNGEKSRSLAEQRR